MGWGNSVQRANRLYNSHLSEEIKSKLINKSDFIPGDETVAGATVWRSFEDCQ